MSEYQPYFVAYAHSQGMDPAALIDARPGLWRLDFMSWIQARWREYRKHIGAGPNAALTTDEREAFQGWLDGRAA